MVNWHNLCHMLIRCNEAPYKFKIMMLLTLLVPALIIVVAVAVSSNDKKKLRPIKVPVNKRKF